MAGRDRQQMEVVVAEHGDRRVAERHDVAQHGKRVRAAIDEIAGSHRRSLAGEKPISVEQLAELGMATLDVADRVERHGVGVEIVVSGATDRVGTIGRRL